MSKPINSPWLRLEASVAAAATDLYQTGLVAGVSVITEGNARGHSYYAEDGTICQVVIDATTLLQVKECAEAYAGGLKVRLSHWSGVDAIVGKLSNFRVDGIKLRADLQLFKTHEQFAHLVELIQTIPDTFGLSIDFSGEAEIDLANRLAKARCVEIYSADLVTEPAANPDGLFERGSRSAATRLPPARFDTPKRAMNPTSKPNPAPAKPLEVPPAPAAPAASTPPAAPDLAQIAQTLQQIQSDLTTLTERVTKIEASEPAAPAAAPAATTPAPMSAPASSAGDPMVALTQTVSALVNRFTAVETKIGLAAAAAPGAAPVNNPSQSEAPKTTREVWGAKYRK